ncbi:MAG: AAA family ATPase [Candidatus Bathyarchaeia archaeon]
MRTGIFISGTSGYGKTNLAFHIADEMMRNGIGVNVFDPSQAWQNSSIPVTHRFQNYENTQQIDYPKEKNTIYDISLLYVEQQKELITTIVRDIFNRAVRLKNRPRRVIIFEECQLLVPQGRLQSIEAQEVLRLMTVGRNFNLRFILITQRPATVDKTAVSLCGQKYLGRVDELNDIRYLKNWIGDWVEKLPSLNIGEFIYSKGNELEVIQTPLFVPQTRPRKKQSLLRRIIGI